MDEDKKMALTEAIEMVVWTNNWNVTVSGYTPLQLMTGKSVILHEKPKEMLQHSPYIKI